MSKWRDAITWQPKSKYMITHLAHKVQFVLVDKDYQTVCGINMANFLKVNLRQVNPINLRMIEIENISWMKATKSLSTIKLNLIMDALIVIYMKGILTTQYLRT